MRHHYDMTMKSKPETMFIMQPFGGSQKISSRTGVYPKFIDQHWGWFIIGFTSVAADASMNQYILDSCFRDEHPNLPTIRMNTRVPRRTDPFQHVLWRLLKQINLCFAGMASSQMVVSISGNPHYGTCQWVFFRVSRVLVERFIHSDTPSSKLGGRDCGCQKKYSLSNFMQCGYHPIIHHPDFCNTLW